MNAYDEIPYLSGPFRNSHVDRLATIATLHGLDVPALDGCRVLELGCGRGDNLLPMAEQLPQARFVGVDGSATAIENARRMAAAAGLTNVELLHGDLRSVELHGEFDYLVAHGIFSWVPREVQDKLLAICGEHLAPNGVAYVSYNCYPGWHLRGTVHHLLRFATRDCRDANERIGQGRKLAAALAEGIRDEGDAHSAELKRILSFVAEQTDSYLFHEYMAEVNEPLYFHEFMDRAAAQDLQYLADADYGVMTPDNLPHSIKQQLALLAASPLDMEQYLDFVHDRKFRRSLLCRASARLGRADPQRLRSLYVASGAKADAVVELETATPATFRGRDATLVSGEAIVKAALLELGKHWPRAVSFNTLLMLARGRLPAGRDQKTLKIDDGLVLAAMLLNGFYTGIIELSAAKSSFTLQPSRRPLASPIARLQAESSESVTNLRHETVGLDFIRRQMLRFLDGRHDQAGIVARLMGLVEEGTLAIHDSGVRVSESAQARRLLVGAVDANLPIVARLALLAA